MANGEQTTLFSQNTIQQINIYNQAACDESKVGGDLNVKFTPTQKQAIHSLAIEHGLKDSQFIREMVDVAIELFPYRDKLKKHKQLLLDLLNTLP